MSNLIKLNFIRQICGFYNLLACRLLVEKELGAYVIRIQHGIARTRFSLDRVSSKYSTRIRDPRNNGRDQLDELI